MDYLLLVILIVLVLAALAILLALYKRAKGAGGGAVEGELRQRIDALEAEAESLRADLGAQHQARVAAETRLEAERENLAEQKRLLAEAETKLKDAFKALSAEALEKSGEQFLGQAAERLKPLRELLDTYQKRLGEVEKARTDAYGGLREYLDTLRQANEGLQKQAHELSTALRSSPTARGQWGEVTLRRVVEVAGMSPHCDFDEQATTDTDEGRLRPDMTVHLPNDRVLFVDAKVPLAAYMEAVEAADDGERGRALARHARHVRDRMVQLGQKAYGAHVETSPDFVVLFLPLESAFSAALEQDRALIEDGMKNGVVLATPTTLIALLRAVHYGWRQQEMAENAARIGETGRELYDRVCVFLEHFAKVGDGLRGAADAYNRAVRSYETRLAPSARRLEEQSAAGRELPEVKTAEGPVRALPPMEAETDAEA
jgi:DNA recombination protein RmuC